MFTEYVYKGTGTIPAPITYHYKSGLCDYSSSSGAISQQYAII
jgi:hypothetical protein